MTCPGAEAASCPQLGEGDIRALAEKSGFDPISAIRRAILPHCTAGFSRNGVVVCGSRPEEGTS